MNVNLGVPVRAYLDGLVHASARRDPLAAARHRGFIASRLLGGALALGLLPVYLVARGTLTPPEAVIFGWFLAPIGVAFYLSRTGRYESAHVLSSLALAALATLVAAMSGGLSSPAALWLVIVPFEAALSESRRAVLFAITGAFVGAITLFAAGSQGLSLFASAGAVAPFVGSLSIAGATIYAAALAFGAVTLTRTGSELLNQEEERYRLLALNMTDVISRHGPGGLALFVSPAAEKLFGVAPEELLRHGLFDRVHVADRPAYLTALSEAAAGKEACSAEFRVRRNAEPGAREAPYFIWLEMRCRSLAPTQTEGSGGNCDVVAVMREVTERKAQEQAVADARRQAEQADAAKSRFLATMSHELRTPLNAILGFSEMLMNESTLPLDAERRHDYARLINDSGLHLLSVVNLVLDMSKIETGNFVITAEPFAPAPAIRNCCDLLALKARDAGLEIVVRMAADLPEIVADKRALKQMLLNLLSNAIKFTERGGRVTVSAGIEARQLVIAIEDTGVGISADDLPRIGSPFFQARNSYDRPYEGTGLGLSIVKGLVELHGGALQLDSRVGVGTCVTVRLPLDCERRGDERPTVIELAGALRAEPDPASIELAAKPEPEKKRA